MNGCLITTLLPDARDLWSAWISSHNIIDRWEHQKQTFTNLMNFALSNVIMAYGHVKSRLSTHHVMHKAYVRSNLPILCPVTATRSSVWAPTQPDRKASSDRTSSFTAITTSLSCSPLCKQLTEKNPHECFRQYSVWPKWLRQTCNMCWTVYMKNKFRTTDRVISCSFMSSYNDIMAVS
jgi:hypothetical protein